MSATPSDIMDNMRAFIENAQKPQVFRKPTLNDFVEAAHSAKHFDKGILKLQPTDVAYLKRLCSECSGVLYDVNRPAGTPMMFFGARIVEDEWAMPR